MKDRDLEPDLPIVIMVGAFDITLSSATSGGSVISDGGAPVTAKGVCWSASSYLTIADSHTNDGTGTGMFVSSLTAGHMQLTV